jgi:HK97 family phage major capsid protein
MWLELLKDVGEHKAGKFIEIADEPVARSYIAAGLAKDGGDGPDVVILQRSIDTFRTELRGFVDQTAAAITDAASQVRTRPRNVAGAGLDIGDGTITPGTAEADRRRGPGNYIRSIVRALANRDEDAHAELVKPWNEGGYGVRLNGSRAMVEGQGSAGGYTTPVLYESQVFKVASQMEIIVPYATQVPLGAREVFWPALNQYSAPAAGQSAFFGGMQVFRKGETLHRTEVDLAFKYVKMVAQDLTAYSELSRDLVQDSSVSIDGMVVEQMGRAIGWREDYESFLGNGIGQFQGILNAAATLSVSRNTSNQILYEDVFTMPTRLWQPEDPCWITHPYTMYNISTLVDPANHFIFIANAYNNGGGGDAAFKLAGQLLGRPIYTSEWAPVLGSTGDLTLIDRKKYLVGRRSGLEIGLSEHFRFDQDEIAIRAKIRNDGQPWLKAPIYLADGSGSNQVSGFVSLHS